MKPNRMKTVEEYKLGSSFERVRKTLLETQYADRLERPLAYWALPNDRRLPLAFLGHSLGSLLEKPFEELSSTPGIGQKKIGALVKLLNRATKDHPPEVPYEASRPAALAPVLSVTPESPSTNGESFDPSIVSEALWVLWRDTVRESGQRHEKLGRLAPSLQALPTVIWHTPMSEYIDRTVAEIRCMKTHGEKRVRVILEVFYVVHEFLAGAGSQDHLAIRLVPGFILPIERWIDELLAAERVPSDDEIKLKFIGPMLEQINVDAGPTIARLAEGRLGTEGTPQSVRQQSRRMAVTRARVYQLLDDCGKVMAVRWSDGRHLLAALGSHLQKLNADDDQLRMFNAAVELFYPAHDREGDND